MSFDPKVRNPVSTPLTPTAPKPATQTPAPSTLDAKVATPAKGTVGHSTASGFDTGYSEGRRVTGGVADDSVGRRTSGGVADDSVGRTIRGGVADDSVGRGARGGVADDSVGRSIRGGVADDSVGRRLRGGVADDSVGQPEPDPVRDGLFSGVMTAQEAAAQDALFNKLENPSYLSAAAHAPAPAELDKLKGQLTGLSTAQTTALLAQAKKDPVVGASLVSLASAKVPADVRASLLQTLASKPSAAVSSVVAHLAASEVFQTMGAAGQQQMAAVLGASNEHGVQLLGALAEQEPQTLNDVDSKGNTLLSNLAQMAKQPLNSNLYGKTTTDVLLASTLLDVVNPGRVDQGTAPTCTVTSMQFELVSNEPAEYARLMTGLTGPAGSATMRNGGKLELQRGDADPDARDDRTISQALFQTATMEYGNGKSADFDPISGESTSTTGDEFRGLKPAQQTQVLRQLFGVNYRSDNFYSEAQGAKALEKLRGYDAHDHVNRPVILQIDQGTVNHAVALEKIADGRVYFRDPYGALRSMPEAMFSKYVVAVNHPADLVLH